MVGQLISYRLDTLIEKKVRLYSNANDIYSGTHDDNYIIGHYYAA